jgi:hypothetical protein
MSSHLANVHSSPFRGCSITRFHGQHPQGIARTFPRSILGFLDSDLNENHGNWDYYRVLAGRDKQ